MQRDVLTFIPPKPIREFVYLCDKKFRTELIVDLYETHDDYGILHLSGCEFNFYVLNGKDLFDVSGTTRKKLPRTHCRGGQSQNRIARLRDEAIHNYLVKINEKSVELFIDRITSLPKIKGLVIMGAGNKKNMLLNILDPRIKTILLDVITTERLDYDSAHEAVQLSIKRKSDSIVKSVLEKTEMLEYGINEIMESLEGGIMESIIVTHQRHKDIEKKHKINLKQMCSDVGCTLHIIDNMDVDLMGGVIGKKWF